MSLGWLSEPAVLPSESKEIPVDPSSSHELAQAVFDKELECRQYGAVITNRQKITTLRNQQKQFIENQNAAQRDEFVRQQNQRRNQQRMQQKINKYESLMKGDSNVVSNEYLVNFGAKGIDVTMEEHQTTLMKMRNETNKNNKNKIDYDLYEDMVIDHNEISNKAHKKLSFEDKMKTQRQHRKQLIIDAKKRKKHFIERIKTGNIDALIHEMKEIHTKHEVITRAKPVFTNKTKQWRKKASFVHKRIAMEIANKKRKLNDRNDTNKSTNDDIEPLTKRFKSKSMDKECGYATIPPPKSLYPTNRAKEEAVDLIESVLMEDKQDKEQKQQTFVPNTASHMYGHLQYQQYPQTFNAHYAYNPYFQYNPYMNYQNMQYAQYQYYNPQIPQYPYMVQHNPWLEQSTNDTSTTKPADCNQTT